MNDDTEAAGAGWATKRYPSLPTPADCCRARGHEGGPLGRRASWEGQDLAGRVRDEVSRSSFGSSATSKTRTLWKTCGSFWPLGRHRRRGMGRGDRLGRPAATSLPARVWDLVPTLWPEHWRT
ncbi:hypothetical protein TNCT6_68030 [Streptomyces sp. 6-11-2]|nr:hypothetical protein TNCT6_68030 [Streptomyces sp. 6-11-2]